MSRSTNAAKAPWPARLRLLGALSGLLIASPPLLAQAAYNACGNIANAYGPFDYRTQRDKLVVVEAYHFKPHVEAVIRLPGMSGASLGGDMDYTLRASPNHHRALVAMMRYGERLKIPKVPGADYSVECYFDRAIRFAPDDSIPRMLYAGFLTRQGRIDQAERQLEVVAEQAKESAFTLYNVGIVYLEMNKPERALEFDHRAKALGWPRKDLEDKLRALGKWRDPVAVPNPPADAASAPAPAASASPLAAAGAAVSAPSSPASAAPR